MKNITTILFILLVSCTRQNDNVTGQSDTNDTTETGDTFDFIINNGQIGNLRTGEQVTDAIKKLNQFIVVLDSIPECEACDTYSPLYIVNDLDNKELFSFEPGWDSTNHDKVFRMSTANKKFITDKGIRVGMTLMELKEKYDVDEVDVGGETGVHILVKGFKGSFGVETPRLDDWWKTNKENIPDSLLITDIVIL
jgi:hypothetical protein